MAIEPEQNSEPEKVDETDEQAPANSKPSCPNCGWHNVRLSTRKGPLDLLLSTFSFKAFRCRTCGHRFHTFRRAVGH